MGGVGLCDGSCVSKEGLRELKGEKRREAFESRSELDFDLGAFSFGEGIRKDGLNLVF